MKFRSSAILVLTCLILFCFISGATHSRGVPPPPKKISDISWGRFVAWNKPFGYPDYEYNEGDLFKRVYADHISKTHKDLAFDTGDYRYAWSLYFGAADNEDSLDEIPTFVSTYDEFDPAEVNAWSEEQNWVYKKFAVVRDNVTNTDVSSAENYLGREYTYTVSLNCLSPGTRIQTKNNVFYLKNSDHGFGYISYMDNLGFNEVDGDFTDPSTPSSFLLGMLSENWILLFDTKDDDRQIYNIQIPVLISFSHEPIIRCDTDYIKFYFLNKDPSDELTVFISLPFGVDTANVSTDWIDQDGLPLAVIEQCRLVNRMVNTWPVDVEETYSFINSKPGSVRRVAIRNTFSFSYMGCDWVSTPYEPYGVLPPILALAASRGIDVTIPTNAEDIGTPTKLGPMMMIDQGDPVEYEIPGAPKHDVHLVGTTGETPWKQRVNRVVNAEILQPDKYRLDPDGTLNAGLFSAVSNKGGTASLAMTRDWTKEHYIDWMKHVIDSHAFNPDLYWEELRTDIWETSIAAPPAEGSWPEFWSYLHRTNEPYIPADIDAQMGTLLEFLYEYGLWSGDWDLINNNWDSPAGVGISTIFKPLELFHDWAYMAGSHDFWGGGGAIMDMFPAQLAGYHAYAKMAEALGKESEAAWGRYLAAKAQIPFIMRWLAKDYISDYFKVDPGGTTQIISGFGEYEPSGPFSNCEWSIVHVLDNWADWSLSGERIHLLGYDVLHTLLEDDFESILLEYLDEWNNTIVTSLEDDHLAAGFSEAKIYGFFKCRHTGGSLFWTPEKQDTLLKQFYTDYTSTNDVSGPSLKWKAYMADPYNWIYGTVYFSEGLRKTRIYPLMPAIMEAYYVPVRVGSWAPARLDWASYDPVSSNFTANFKMDSENPVTGAPNPVVRLQVEYEPYDIKVNGSSVNCFYNDTWQVVEIPLGAGNEWAVEATIEPCYGATWDSTDPDSNLISDPGFEECGQGFVGALRPNYEMNWGCYPPYPSMIHATSVEPQSGDHSACLSIHDEDDLAQLYQYIWVGPVDENDPPHTVNLDFRYRFGCGGLDPLDPDDMAGLEDLILIVKLRAKIGGIGDQAYPDPNEVVIYTEYILCEDAVGDACYEWQHYSLENIEMPVDPSTGLADHPVLAVHIYLDHRSDKPWNELATSHDICIDKVVLTCPQLDTGEGGLNLSSPKPASIPPLPVLSNFVSYPNPFNPSVRISFHMGQHNHALLNIYDVSGRLVKTLVDKTLPAGQHSFVWDGKNNRGATTSSGVYFYRLNIADKGVKGKLILLR